MGRVPCLSAEIFPRVYDREALFFDYVVPAFNKTIKGNCWLVTNNEGILVDYPHVRIDDINVRLNRLIAYLYHNLDITNSNEHACHLCDVKSCIYPFHIYKGDAKMNGMDKQEFMKVMNYSFIELTKLDPIKVFKQIESQRRMKERLFRARN